MAVGNNSNCGLIGESGSLRTAHAPQAGEEAYRPSFTRPPTQIGRSGLRGEEHRKENKIGITCQRNLGAREIAVDGHRRRGESRTGAEPHRMKTTGGGRESSRRKPHSKQSFP